MYAEHSLRSVTELCILGGEERLLMEDITSMAVGNAIWFVMLGIFVAITVMEFFGDDDDS